jgi:hypothetical protein
MNPATILTMANGKGIDLFDPKPEDIDFAVVAEHLAKECRYNGATPGVFYSVAEHSVRGAKAILAHNLDHRLAAYFLVHDCHEGFLKDDTTPKKQLVAEIAETSFGTLAGHVRSAFDLATYRFDKVIHDAAGLAWPPDSGLQAALKRWDLIMFMTEWRDLMRDIPHPNPAPYSGIKPLPDRIEPYLDWRDAMAEYIAVARAILPALQRQAEAL